MDDKYHVLTPTMLVTAAELYLDPTDWDELSQDLERVFERIADMLVEAWGGEVKDVTWGKVIIQAGKKKGAE